MKLYITCLALFLVVSGCGLIADAHYEDTLTSLKGRPIEDVEELLGPPTHKTHSYYTWVYREEINHPGRWRSVPKEVILRDRHNKIIGTTTIFQQEYDEPWVEYRNCATTIFIGPENIVKDFVFKGNYCGEWYESLPGYQTSP